MSHVVSLALSRETISLGELRGPTSGGRGNILPGLVGVKGIWGSEGNKILGGAALPALR